MLSTLHILLVSLIYTCSCNSLFQEGLDRLYSIRRQWQQVEERVERLEGKESRLRDSANYINSIRAPYNSTEPYTTFIPSTTEISIRDKSSSESFHRVPITTYADVRLPRFKNIKKDDVSANKSRGSRVDSLLDQLIKMPLVEGLTNNAWSQLKGSLLMYLNVMNLDYETITMEENYYLAIIKKFLEFGDQANFVRLLSTKVHPDLVKHLATNLDPVLFRMKTLDKYIPSDFNINDLERYFKTIIPWTVKLAFSKLNGLSVSTLAEEYLDTFSTHSDPLVSAGVKFLYQNNNIYSTSRKFDMKSPFSLNTNISKIFNSATFEEQDDYQSDGEENKISPIFAGTGRQGGYQDYNSGGYGGQGAEDSSYNMGASIDPYLILGGIGAAALLAFIAYRIIVSTAAPGRRAFSGMDSLQMMELTDLPDFLFNIYKFIESPDATFGGAKNLDLSLEDMARGMNNIWQEKLKSSEGCIKCVLFDFLHKHVTAGRNYIDNLVMSGVASSVGAKGAGHLLDKVQDAYLEDKEVKCIRNGDSCNIRPAMGFY